ncbi:hypothetical protein [Lentzea aerocolonigenes]|nr:hypothetical protein [Lentzea aerocolonigenes]MCP2241797.1 hypothetical protein [Lentzea aerocolonigenes]
MNRTRTTVLATTAQGQLMNRTCNTGRHHPAPFSPAAEASR